MMELKTIDDINRMFSAANSPRKTGGKQRQQRVLLLRIVSEVLFYLALLSILYSVLSVDISDDIPASVMRHSAYVVMSSSMEGEIPKGSLIITRSVKAASLKPGDNITFSRGGEVIVTHKIIGITIDDVTDKRHFRTRGINNASPDDYIVDEAEVIGKVIITIPEAGAFINIFGDNIYIVLIIYILCSILSFLLRGVSLKKREAEYTAYVPAQFSK